MRAVTRQREHAVADAKEGDQSLPLVHFLPNTGHKISQPGHFDPLVSGIKLPAHDRRNRRSKPTSRRATPMVIAKVIIQAGTGRAGAAVVEESRGALPSGVK